MKNLFLFENYQMLCKFFFETDTVIGQKCDFKSRIFFGKVVTMLNIDLQNFILYFSHKNMLLINTRGLQISDLSWPIPYRAHCSKLPLRC